MFSRLGSLRSQWMVTPLVVVLTMFLYVCSVDCTTTTPTPTMPCYSDGAVTSLASRDPCPREYLRCENSVWSPAMCAGGIINNETRECVPYTRQCPDPDFTERTFTSRSKRQASPPDNCLRSYMCPANLSRIFIYPDWVNGNCDSYVVCVGNKLLVSSCLRDGYKYYNPLRLSCEAIASLTNICVYRRNTVFGS